MREERHKRKSYKKQRDKFETTTPILLQKTAVVNVDIVHSALQNSKITNSFKEIGQKLHCALQELNESDNPEEEKG